jgi:hypothetical protein
LPKLFLDGHRRPINVTKHTPSAAYYTAHAATIDISSVATAAALRKSSNGKPKLHKTLASLDFASHANLSSRDELNYGREGGYNIGQDHNWPVLVTPHMPVAHLADNSILMQQSNLESGKGRTLAFTRSQSHPARIVQIIPKEANVKPDYLEFVHRSLVTTSAEDLEKNAGERHKLITDVVWQGAVDHRNEIQSKFSKLQRNREAAERNRMRRKGEQYLNLLDAEANRERRLARMKQRVRERAKRIPREPVWIPTTVEKHVKLPCVHE